MSIWVSNSKYNEFKYTNIRHKSQRKMPTNGEIIYKRNFNRLYKCEI